MKWEGTNTRVGNIADPSIYLLVKIIHQAQIDYRMKCYRAEINRFCNSDWFDSICRELEIDTDITCQAIRGKMEVRNE